jgi:serine/threonine protein kinase
LLLGDRYRALQPISQGGFGQTFLGVDEWDASKSRCIIKLLSSKNLGTDNVKKAAELFRQEVTRLQELGQHPQIPQLLACFEPDNQVSTIGAASRAYPALVQSFIEGQSLAQQLKLEGAFSETQIRQLLDELLPVLQFVHERGVIHRDINPENIIRRHSDGQLVLVDFGAAKFTTKTALAKTGTLIGSAAYTAQEQLMGKAVTSSDLYSLGVTCIHLLTDIHPFDLFNSLEGIWVWQDYLTNPVSNELSQILNKMLDGTVRQRYQSAEEILKDLHPHSHPPTTSVKSASISTQSPPETPKSIIPTWSRTRSLSDHLSSINALAFSSDGQMLASGSADRTVKLWNPDSRIPRCTLSGHSSLIDAVVFSLDGATLASGSWDHTIKIWQFETGELIRTLSQHSGWIKCLAIAPDGQTLISGSADRTIKIWHLGTGEVQTTLLGHSSAVHSVALSTDGQKLASGSADKTIKLWNLDPASLQLTLNGHSDAINSLTFSPSGQILISGSADKTIKIWNLSSGTLLHTLNGHSEAVNSVAINRQGNILVSGSADKTIKIWHPSSGELLYRLDRHSAAVTAVAISPDSRRIASGSQDKTILIWQFE